MTTLIAIEDIAAARLCELAADRLRFGPIALAHLHAAEREACEAIARAAIDAERELREVPRNPASLDFWADKEM